MKNEDIPDSLPDVHVYGEWYTMLRKTGRPTDWNAFYDSATDTIHTSEALFERAKSGSRKDLMTLGHEIGHRPKGKEHPLRHKDGLLKCVLDAVFVQRFGIMAWSSWFRWFARPSKLYRQAQALVRTQPVKHA